VWVSTNQGLSRINLADATVFNFQLSDGLQGHEFNSRTAWIAPDGEFFFGGTRGFNHFYPDQIQINTHLPTVTLTDFKVKEKPYPLATYIGEAHSLVLSDQESTFSIDYSAIDYFSNGHNTYQYRLLGLDSNWIQVGSQTTARFMQVPAGTYQFEVKAANNDGLWNEVPTTLSIEIEPRLWETIWFRVVMLLLLVAGSYGIYRYRLYRIQLRQRHEMAIMVETQETERQRFAQDLHDGLGANLSAMKMILGLIKDPSSRPIKEKTESLLNESIDDLRQLIHAMSPRSLARLGLVKAVEEMAIIINQAHKVEVRVSAENFPNQLPDEIQTNLFRIVQELLQNAAKHAEATHITLALHQTTQHLVLHYTDNGRGFDASTSATAGHGLLNLQTRAQLLNATLNIHSVPGKGTSVHLEMPYL
jgi:signal transduction histidine kinase